ncbi:MAG TPA: bacteriohopanetetrol glucosamine biosynthesis glycosyltransferase HpnI [Acidobacteriota bacterium]|nr:bacteriohopanetetrol glucosamine biosynthesis glycosyltransferase HpnI [Acidobacteriota bacterium]
MVLLTIVKFLLFALAVAANAYFVLCMVAAFRFFSKIGPKQSPLEVPVTILIPIRGAEFEGYENYASFCRQSHPRYQIVFGVQDPYDTELSTLQRLAADFPGKDITVHISAETIGNNSKVNNLQNMLSAAKYEHIVIVDSDIRVGPDYLSSIVADLCEPGVGLVTCLYRGRACDLPSRLEAIGITSEFAPGVLSARLLEGIKFALGATMAMTRSVLQEIGGMHAIADYLADDFMLGHLISKAGYECRLSHCIVETVLAPTGVSDMIRHQIRWARGIRVCRPLGYLGMIITYGTALALLFVAAAHASMGSLILLAATLVMRLVMAWHVGVHCLKDRVLKKSLWLIPFRDVLSFLIWCIGLVGRRVEWRGEVYRLVGDGKLQPDARTSRKLRPAG